jgi:hypothetical protein
MTLATLLQGIPGHGAIVLEGIVADHAARGERYLRYLVWFDKPRRPVLKSESRGESVPPGRAPAADHGKFDPLGLRSAPR